MTDFRTLPLTFEQWLDSLKFGIPIRTRLQTLWTLNGCLFSLENAEGLLSFADAVELAHLLGVLDCYCIAESGEFPQGESTPVPPGVRVVLDRLVAEWCGEPA